jgi:hypothetical protein
MLACEFEQDGRDAVMPESNRHAHTQAAARLRALALEIGFRRFQFGERPYATVVIGLTGFGQRLATCRAMQKTHTKTRFETRNHFADCRTREMHAFSRKRETARVDDLHKGRHAIEPVRHIGSLQE